MVLHPMISALRRSKAGAVLVVLQVAMTLAIVSNIVAIAGTRALLVSRPTGTAEESLFAIGFRLTDGVETPSAMAADLRAVRAVPGVVDAVSTNGFPLRGTSWSEGVSTRTDARTIQEQNGNTAVYAMDGHGIDTLGLHLVEGRNFVPDDVQPGHFNAAPLPAVAIISEPLARALFPVGEALGKSIYLSSAASKPIAVIGVVERLQTGDAASSLDTARSEYSIVLPMTDESPRGLLAVRTAPGAMAATMPAVRQALTTLNPARIFGRMRPFEEVRREAYAKDRAIAIALAAVSAVLVAVTALGIVGLTSFWVARRKRHIGIRRALGASRRAIVTYFLAENAMLCIAGTFLGMFLAIALNATLWRLYAVERLSLPVLVVSALGIVLVGQCAAWMPSIRAGRVEPATALRSI